MMPTAIHSFSQEEVMAYFDGELASDRALAVGRHLEECLECGQLAGDFRGVSRQLREWEVEPNACEAPQFGAEPRIERRPVFWKRPSVWIAVAAAGVLTILFAPSQVNRADTPGVAAFEQMPMMNMRATEPSSYIGEAEHAFLHRSSVRMQSIAPSTTPVTPLAPPTTPQGASIIKTAGLNLTSNDVERSRVDIERITQAHQGYIAQLQSNAPAGAGRSLNASIRVPAGQLEEVLQELRRLGHVDSEAQGGEEVTQRVVDAEARLANLRTTEKRLLQLLQDRSGGLADVLRVEEVVDRTREQIEVAEAEQKALARQIALAAIQLRVSEEYKTALGGNLRPIGLRLRNAAVEGYRDLIEMVISGLAFLLSTGPSVFTLLIGGMALAFFPARWLWRKRRGL